jgi:hypothetical protein
MGEFSRSWPFMPSPLILGKLANKRVEAGFMVFAIKPSHVPSLDRQFHWKLEEATKRASLESNAPNNYLVSTAWLVFQGEIVLKQRKVWRNPLEGLTEMDKD